MNIHYYDKCEIILFVVKSNPKHHLKSVLFLMPKAKMFYGTILGQELKACMMQFEAFTINVITGESQVTIAAVLMLTYFCSRGFQESQREKKPYEVLY